MAVIPGEYGRVQILYLQFVVFTKDEKNKWGSREMIGIKCSEWKR